MPRRLHPEDGLARARNRAWTDYVPSFSSVVSSLAYSMDEETFNERREQVPDRFHRLEGALETRGNDGPYFNGPDFSLVDAAYAPSLQRYTFLDAIHPLGIIDHYPLLAAWRDALLARESVKNSTVEDFEGFWRDALVTRGRWVAQFIEGAAAAE